MIAGIGIDLVSIERTEQLIGRWGQRFLAKVFTDSEIAAGLSRPRPAEEFAAWFGAKEAVMKALGMGMAGGVRFRDIEVAAEMMRRPGIKLTGKAREIAEACGVEDVHLSLSHEREYAAAVVVLVKEKAKNAGNA